MARAHVLLLLWLISLYKHVSYGQMPMSMWRRMANVSSTQEFLNEFVNLPERQGTIAQYTAMGQSQRESIANIVTGEAGCIPQEDTVSIPSDADVNIVRWPTCTRVNRCSGCCGHEMLQCTPTNVQMQPVQVLKARYPFPGADRLVVEGIEEVLIERHLACECRCRVQPQNCNAATQRYDAIGCRCICIDQNQWQTCRRDQVWDESTCSCVCRNTLRCLTNEVFNNNTCRCENFQGGSANEIIRTTPSPLTPPVSTMNPCPLLRCLAGQQAQVMLGLCRCMVVHRYTSSQTSLEEDRLFQVEAAEYNRYPKPHPDDIFTRYTLSPKHEVPHIFQRHPLRQQSETARQDEIFQSDAKKEEPPAVESEGDPVKLPESQSPSKKPKTVEHHQGSPNSINNGERHHVDITVTNHKPKRYAGAHHAEGGPLELMQPMVQANYGHV